MRKSKLYRVALLALLLSSVVIDALPQQPAEVRVWAVGSDERKVYHCPGSRWYRVGDGKEIGECQALHEGYRPAFGGGCGSSCSQATACFDKPVSKNGRVS